MLYAPKEYLGTFRQMENDIQVYRTKVYWKKLPLIAVFRFVLMLLQCCIVGIYDLYLYLI